MGEGRGIYSVAMFHVAADAYRSQRRFFFQNNRHFLLILSQLFSNPKLMASGLFFMCNFRLQHSLQSHASLKEERTLSGLFYTVF